MVISRHLFLIKQIYQTINCTFFEMIVTQILHQFFFRKQILSKSGSMFRKCSQKNNQILWAQSPITILSMHLTSNFNSFLQWSLFTNFTCFTIDASILFSKRFLHNMKYYQIFVKRNFPRCAQILGKRHIDYNASWETARIEQYLERLT